MDSKIVEIAFKFFSLLTWKRVVMLILLWLFTVASVILWINREYIAGLVKPGKLTVERPPLIVSDKGKAAIDETLKKSAYNINTIFVVSALMERNTRRIIYWRTIDAEIDRQHDEFVRTHATEDIPLFNEDPVNNRRMIAFINGEFVCNTWEQASAARYLHDVNIKYVCGTAVPPLYGKFRGIVVAFIKTVPDAEEQTRLKILLRDLADALDNPSSSK